jgi:hypothetical protein
VSGVVQPLRAGLLDPLRIKGTIAGVTLKKLADILWYALLYGDKIALWAFVIIVAIRINVK